jgi:hypothetical protein
MSQNLGALTVTLEANMVRFNQGMDEAARRTEQGAARMQTGLNAAKAAVAALAGVATVGALAGLVKGAIDAADNLRDMSQKTGIAVEELNGLGFAAGQAGGSLDSMVGAAGKLNKSILDAAGGGKETGEAFKALGIDVIDATGALKKTDVVMTEMADQFAKYRDGPEKAAIAIALFGKSGADMIPMLNDGGNAMRENVAYAKQYSGATTELSNAADNFNDTMGKLEVQQRGFANAVAAEVLPVLQLLADGILGAAEQSSKFEISAGVIGEAIKRMSLVAYDATADFQRLGTVIGGVAAINAAFLDGGLGQARAARAEMQASLTAINEARADFKAGLNDGGNKDVLGSFVADLKTKIGEEKQLLDSRMRMLNKYHADEKLSEKEFAAAKKAASAESSKSLNALYDFGILQLNGVKKKGIAKDPDALSGLIDSLAAEKLMIGSGKPAAPRLAGGAPTKAKKEGKSDAEKAIEEGAKMVASLKEQADTYGLTGAALLEYQLAGKGYSAQQKEQALDHQANIDAIKAEDAAVKESADNLKRFVDDAKRLAEQNDADVKQIRAGLMTQAQAEDAYHASALEKLQIFHDTKLENVALANSLIKEENARHEQEMSDMQASRDMQSLSMFGETSDALYGLMQQAGQEQSALGKAAFLASKAIAVAEIIMQTNVAATKAEGQLGIFGLPMSAVILATGYARAGMVAGQAIASAEGGYDIPAGTNPMTQLHEKEMVLPRAQADVIRSLASGGGGTMPKITVVNNGAPLRVVEARRISQDEMALIVENTKSAVAADLSDPNSKTSRSMGRNFNVPRTR